MLQKLNKSSISFKASLLLLSFLILTSSGPFKTQKLFAASINSINIDGTNIIVNTDKLEKLKMDGKGTRKITLEMPDVLLDNMYKYNTTELTNQIKKNIPGIQSIEVVQYSLETCSGPHNYKIFSNP